MSYIINNEIQFSDSPNLDAFSRLRVSQPFSIFNSSLVSESGDTSFETYLVSGGTITYNSEKSEVQFSVFSNGDRIVRQQHGYNFYQPGKSQLSILTGVFGTPTAGVIKRIGYYDDNDGLFFQCSGITFGVNLRTSTSGSVVDTFIPQSEWNIDTLDTGSTLNPSGKHLDITKTNIYLIQFQWLGVGRVIFCLDIDGIIQPVHEILNANNKTEVYMSSGSLPVRYELISEGGSDSTFKQICSTVISEGGQEEFGYLFSVSNELTTRTIAASSSQAILSIRLSDLFNGKTNRIKLEPVGVELFTTTTNVNAYWKLVLQRGYLGETNLGGTPTWTEITGSGIEYSVNGTTTIGGITIESGFVSATVQGGLNAPVPILKNKNFLSLNISGDSSDYLHLVITPSSNSSWSGKVSIKSKY
jgi:hypothetical protein